MALTLMLRPSDIAPKSVILSQEGSWNNVFTLSQIHRCDGGALCIVLHGTKNDYHRDGQEVYLRPCVQDALMCPVQALDLYQELLSDMGISRRPQDPVFVTLRPPFHALTAAGFSAVLNKGLRLAGLSGFSAKSFRPTGATIAVEQGVSADMV